MPSSAGSAGPIGIKSYKPHHSSGEDFLHNYLGMIGIPIDLYADFPTDAGLVLLTESAKSDPDIVAKIKAQLDAGKSVVITSGLLRALQGRGIEDIVEVEFTERRIAADGYTTGFGSGSRSGLGDDVRAAGVLFPEIRFNTNDAWALVSAMSDNVGFPLLLMDRYGKGVLYIWTMPDNFHHLYRLPPAVTSAIKDVVMKGFFVRLDGPSQVALFAYDNNTFIVESFLDHETDVKISVAGGPVTKLRNLVTGEVLSGQEPPPANFWLRRPGGEKRTEFHMPCCRTATSSSRRRNSRGQAGHNWIERKVGRDRRARRPAFHPVKGQMSGLTPLKSTHRYSPDPETVHLFKKPVQAASSDTCAALSDKNLSCR